MCRYYFQFTACIFGKSGELIWKTSPEAMPIIRFLPMYHPCLYSSIPALLCLISCFDTVPGFFLNTFVSRNNAYYCRMNTDPYPSATLSVSPNTQKTASYRNDLKKWILSQQILHKIQLIQLKTLKDITLNIMRKY